jgi:glycosyltransferase involved in cell wall biosynthesis
MRPRPWGIYGFEAGALHTFRRARARGIQTIYDVPIVRNGADIVLSEYRMLNLALARRGLAARPSSLELALADWVVTPSDAVADSVRREGFGGRGLFVVPFGVDIEAFRPAAHRPGRFRVVFAGRLEVRKGLHYLLDAWRGANIDGELVLAGSIGEPEFIDRLRREYAGLFTEAGNLGRRELADLLASADVFVLPSLAEGSALVSYEALACGLPCIVTAETGSVVRDGIEGFIVPPRDSGVIRRRLEMLAADLDLRRRMSAAAVDRAQHFTWDRYHTALLDVMTTVHAGGTG